MMAPADRPEQVALATRQPVRRELLGVTRPDGSQRWLEGDAVPTVDAAGTLRHLVCRCIDVTARRLAEQTGLIQALSQWVLNAALRQCQQWRAAGLHLPVAVNLSMRNLHDSQLPNAIGSLLEPWDVTPAWLTVELTESAVMAD